MPNSPAGDGASAGYTRERSPPWRVGEARCASVDHASTSLGRRQPPGRDQRRRLGAHQPVCTGQPGPSGIPSRYQTTKNAVQMTDRMITYGIISATTVPIPAVLW